MSSPTCADPGALPDALSCVPPAPAHPKPAPARGADGADSAAPPATATVGQELRRIYANLVFLR